MHELLKLFIHLCNYIVFFFLDLQLFTLWQISERTPHLVIVIMHHKYLRVRQVFAALWWSRSSLTKVTTRTLMPIKGS
ncbi:hypothetical protein GLYMA_07G010100v4 [Glycine max]|uniref:Uncharacterized protein n=1 Tax=Glycine max TaxID=3847 RepID=A0A0R0J1X2_SOYBN|nr:hypothetical protein JHK85_017651 [Glycine max]KAG5036420.1 hypothetical protein JHK86_017260 [Glycine max]KAH1084762.1 hypothetical protein GYH30_017032 [Glycine max]KRH47122.1 hypothetical protein GLYMA_07G010100v4 [Glycine max]